jgi:hypothetical protein
MADESDDEFKRRVSTIESEAELLRELIDLQDSTAGIGDPYYRDLFEAIIERARLLLR